MTRQRRPHRGTDGFTLIEALAATVLMGMILAALATVTAQWLPNWDRGFARVQRSELLDLALERMIADLAAAEFVSPSRKTTQPLFEGAELSVTFVRSAFGPNVRGGLEIVRIAETLFATLRYRDTARESDDGGHCTAFTSSSCARKTRTPIVDRRYTRREF